LFFPWNGDGCGEEQALFAVVHTMKVMSFINKEINHSSPLRQMVRSDASIFVSFFSSIRRKYGLNCGGEIFTHTATDWFAGLCGLAMPSNRRARTEWSAIAAGVDAVWEWD